MNTRYAKTNGHVYFCPGILAAFVFFFFVILSGNGFSQTGSDNGTNMENQLEKLSEDAAKGYIAPIVTAFGADLNGAWFHRSPKPKLIGFDIEAGMVAMGTFFTDENRTFATYGSFLLNTTEATQITNFIAQDYASYPPDVQNAIKQGLIDYFTTNETHVSISGPTILGSKTEKVILHFEGGQYNVDVNGFSGTIDVPEQEITLPVTGLGIMDEIQYFPLIVPQFSLGTLFGTQITFRYLSDIKVNDDIGEATYTGIGFQHNPAVWLPIDLQFDLSLGFFTQNLSVGDVLDVNASGIGLTASKTYGRRFANITPYFGVMLEHSSMEVTYNYDIESSTMGSISHEIIFKLQGENESRFTFGANLRFLFFNLNIDYNVGQYNSATAGIMLAF